VHRGHSCERVYVFSALPDGLRVVVSDGVEEAIFFWKEPWWHARIEYEGDKSEEVREGHGPAEYGEGGVGGCSVVVPCN
jgi:hypothetical protein